MRRDPFGGRYEQQQQARPRRGINPRFIILLLFAGYAAYYWFSNRTTDPLTGTLNRRGFETVGQGELARARRKGQELALAHLDLDGFKQINDAYGHAVGDLALQHLVRCLQDGMRPGDVLCRFGGEEFVLLLSETGLDEAVRVLQRHLATLGDRPVPGTRCYLSFSAGVVGVLADETLDAAVQRADAATYVAKRAGRQRVERA